MSGRRARSERRENRERSLHVVNADYATQSADAVLDVDLSGVPLKRVNQFAIGWMRAAFEQSRVIAKLTAAEMGHLAAPNRRVFWELALRLLWLKKFSQSERAEVVDTMLAQDRWNETKSDQYMREMGLDSDIDVGVMDEFVLNETSNTQLREEAKVLTKAAKSEGLNSGHIYSLWRKDSTWTHATGFLAGYFAPADDTTLGVGKPPCTDANLEVHRLVSMLIVFTTSSILLEEGVAEELAQSPTVAFLSAV